MRKPISKKLRFEVFKRDLFTCIYCGSKPPSVVLEIDHLLPVSKGGTNSIDNLVCSCFNCNRGKSNKELTSVPASLVVDNEMIKEKVLQYKEYAKYLKQLEVIKAENVNMIENIYSSIYTEYCFSNKFKMSVMRFIDSLGFSEVYEAMNIACAKRGLNSNTTLTYFCGICWTKIKERQ